MDPKTERNKIIVDMRDKNGQSFGAIGRYFNISKQRAREIYIEERKRQGLSTGDVA